MFLEFDYKLGFVINTSNSLKKVFDILSTNTNI